MHLWAAASLASFMVVVTAMARDVLSVHPPATPSTTTQLLLVELAGLLLLLLHDCGTVAMFWMSFFWMPWPEKDAGIEIIAAVFFTSVFYGGLHA